MAFDRGTGGSQSGSASITTTPVTVAQGGTGATTAQQARTNLGLGSMAQQNYNSVSITGGSIDGISPPIAITSGGTGSNNAAGARINLGLGSVATQNNTDGITEGSTNLYYTDARARSAVSASGDISYNSGTGVFSISIPVTSVAGKTGAVTLTASDVSGLATVATSGSYNDLSSKPSLGTIASQNASNVSITGGSISGITDLAVADGGTGASSSAGALANLLPSYTGNANKTLSVNGTATGVEWSSAGAGDVVGPSSATDGNVVVFDGTTGKLIKSGGTLGTAAFSSTSAFATAAQGSKADSALQSTDIGSTVQGYDGDLNAIAAISGTSGLLKKTAANTWSLDTNSYLTSETDPVYTASSWYGTTNNSSNWNTAYGWGNHASAGYAADSAVVHKTGNETVGGTKTFSSTISGSIDGNAGTVTNGVYTTGDQTIGGTKTFSSTISGSVSGNAGTVTNGVYTTGSYSNPTWITALSETKVLPSQTSNSGKYLKTDGTSTSWATVDALPSQTGNNGKYLTTNGTSASWGSLATVATSGSYNDLSSLPTLGTISSQAANNVSITGGSITGITDLAVADGGTGASTAANARVNLLPSYSSNGGKVLAVNSGATDVEWITASGGQFEGSAANKAIMWNAQTIAEDITITGTHNAGSFGPITINSGYTVTVNSGAIWTIV